MRYLRGIYIIWLREVIRFFREKTRIVGMLGQPLLYLLIVGNGLAATFKVPDAPPGFSYVQFMYPGILGMAVLFTSIYSAISIVWDREFGFLKEVLVAPVPRWTVAVGKALGGSTVAVMQGTIFILLAPLIGVALSPLMVLKLMGVLLVMAFAITSLGITIASRMETMEGFQMIMNFLIMPLFFLSGAMFPLRGVAPWMETLMRLDPLTYGVDALRNIMYGDTPLRDFLVQFSLGLDLLVVAAMALLFVGTGALAFNRQD
ncbi:ABC transporter permease [Desulfoscipio geothermicus]|uniref:Transport permease protein n=1 Tax=Desulfoscipio geothermicus DSM 3669 TaxID=1121426 RepID=A0A1I6CPQ0_9FIRM|nr:ABC transporter permease [Desulfoscipio geothermicus]SFQ95160.1 ABC-2 type transport system permease protein [Desulfoscipio geothermicus DSM 3669]